MTRLVARTAHWGSRSGHSRRASASNWVVAGHYFFATRACSRVALDRADGAPQPHWRRPDQRVKRATLRLLLCPAC